MKSHYIAHVFASATWRLVSRSESNQELFACVAHANSVHRLLQMVCF